MRWHLLAVMAAIALAHDLASAQEARMEIGFLMCSLAGSGEAQSASEAAPQRQTREMLCGFRPINGGPEETYTGTLQSIGQDQELSDRRAMIWIVKGTSAMQKSPGLLQQIYAVDPASGPGQAAPLIGETNASIVLQAMTDKQAPTGAAQAQQGANAVIVLLALRLKSTPT